MNDEKYPLITIITVCYNSKETIEETMKSVVSQSYENIEYIIIDGNSTDGTVEIIKSFNSKFNNSIKLVSEPDKGIYDAMNKGIKLSEGKWICFINSGDKFVNNKVLHDIFSRSTVNDHIIYGNTIMSSDTNRFIKKHPRKVSLMYLYIDMINHQSIFYKKEVFGMIGLYNINEKIFADFEHLLKIYINGKMKFKYVNNAIAVFDLQGISSNVSKYSKIKEKGLIIKKQLGVGQFLIYLLSSFTLKPFNYLIKRLKLKIGVEIFK